jgi:hypothetical protein
MGQEESLFVCGGLAFPHGRVAVAAHFVRGA